jgi:hypothetical protein
VILQREGAFFGALHQIDSYWRELRAQSRLQRRPSSRRPVELKAPMTRATIYLVQGFTAGKGEGLKGDAPIACKSAEGARRTAEKLAASKVGVVAFSSSGDAEAGDYDDEPTVILRIGRLPAAFD